MRFPEDGVHLLREAEPKQVIEDENGPLGDRTSIIFETGDGTKSIAFHDVGNITVQPVMEVANDE